jgi:hypothetical protein
MKQILSALSVAALLVCTSCGNSDDKTTTANTDTVATVAKDTIAAAPAKPAFKPFDVVEIVHTVKDYAKWKPAFDADSAARIEHGLGFIVIARNQKNPNNLEVVLTVADLQKAKDFAASPKLKDVMQKNGVITKPVVSYYHVLRFNPDSKEKQWVEVTHKVKDYDSWVKVFDEEGTAGRANYGLVDVVLARSLADSNTVQLVFDIKDSTKAKARFADPSLKDLMKKAGVIGAPVINFYHD